MALAEAMHKTHSFGTDLMDGKEWKIGSENAKAIMIELNCQQITPQCDDLMVRCRWGDSKTFDCMKLGFKFRKTRSGYCCLFNYVRQFNTLSTQEWVYYFPYLTQPNYIESPPNALFMWALVQSQRERRNLILIKWKHVEEINRLP